METVIKTYIGFFFMMAMLFLGSGIISASLESRNANAYANNFATRIENSNYSSAVVEQCRTEAQALGYNLTVTVKTSSNNAYAHYGLLTLNYQYRIPIIGVYQVHNAIVDLN